MCYTVGLYWLSILNIAVYHQIPTSYFVDINKAILKFISRKKILTFVPTHIQTQNLTMHHRPKMQNYESPRNLKENLD